MEGSSGLEKRKWKSEAKWPVLTPQRVSRAEARSSRLLAAGLCTQEKVQRVHQLVTLWPPPMTHLATRLPELLPGRAQSRLRGVAATPTGRNRTGLLRQCCEGRPGRAGQAGCLPDLCSWESVCRPLRARLSVDITNFQCREASAGRGRRRGRKRKVRTGPSLIHFI